MVILSKLGFVAVGTGVAILSGAALSLLAKRYGWILPTGYALRIPRPILLLNPRAWGQRRLDARNARNGNFPDDPGATV